MKGLTARETALRILFDVNEKGAYINLALNEYFMKSGLGENDRAFAAELVYGVVRWRLLLDKVIEAASTVRMERISPWILNVLRLGSYQLLKTDKIPPSAACNESVKLAHKYGHRASAGYVNAVLRNISRAGYSKILPSREEDPVGYLSVKYSYPEWMAGRFLQQFGEERAASLLHAGNSVAGLVVRVNTLKTSVNCLIDKLADEGVESVAGKYIKESLLIKSPVAIAGLNAYREGLFQVQDESSMLPSIILAPKGGEMVLDACSGPGGKATHMAQLMQNRGTIIARDIYEHKIKLIDNASCRLGISIIKCELHDATLPDDSCKGAFDRILLDAPCSGLGIIRRKPDIKWRCKEEDIPVLATVQKTMMESTAQALKPGGVMVYSTCTMMPEENEAVITGFLKGNSEFEGDDIKSFLPEKLIPHARGCMLQLYPDRDGTDGFFIARIKRKM